MCKIQVKEMVCVMEVCVGECSIINVLLVLALCGGNYFVLCNRCCSVLSVNSP